MNKIVLVVVSLVMITIGITFNSCEEGTGSTSKNKITYLSEDFEVTKSNCTFYDRGFGLYHFSLSIFSEDVTYSVGIGHKGFGHSLDLKMYASTDTIIEPGVYTFSTQKEAGKFTQGTLNVDHNFNSFPTDTKHISGGSVTVTKNGTNYDFSFNLQDDDGNTIEAFYSGSSNIIEFY